MSITLEGIMVQLKKFGDDITGSLLGPALGLPQESIRRLVLISQRYGISIPDLVGSITEGWLWANPPESAEAALPTRTELETDRGTSFAIARRFGYEIAEDVGGRRHPEIGVTLKRKPSVEI